MNPLPLKIALRYIVAKKSHTAVSIISFIAGAAVAVTAMAMICVMSVFNGFTELVDGKMARLEPDLRVTAARGAYIANADSLLATVAAVDGVEAAVPTITEDALIIYGNRQIQATLKGITDDYDRITGIKSLITAGEYALSDPVGEYAILSVGAAMSLEAFPGYTTAYVIAPKRVGPVNVANPASAFRRVPVYVGAVFEARQGEFDQDYAFVSLAAARTLYDYTTEATALELRLAPGADEERVMKAVADAAGDGYRVENRRMQHGSSLKMINMEKWISSLLLLMILVVASFNVVSTLAILILEKGESIATLHALGAGNRMVERIFIAEGWLISVIGAVAGLAVGVALCLAQRQFGIVSLSADTSSLIVDTYPVAISAADCLAVLAIVAAVGLAAAAVTVRAMRGYLRR